MTQLPSIYAIQASDAPQHTTRLQEILQTLKTENRIGDFITLDPDDDLSSIIDTIKEEDLVLIVLSNQLESQKEEIENKFKTLKSEKPGIRVAEIIVDNIPYENEFITLPADLRNIRDREDMDAVWSDIEQSLKDMFPVKKDPEPVPPIAWPKYLKIAGIIISVIVLFFLIRGFWSGDSVERRSVEVEAQAQAEEQVETVVLRGEDCLAFNFRNLQVQADGNQFLITDGRSRMMLFRTREKAVQAVRIIRNYRFDNRCFAIRPNPGLSYFKTQGNIPSESVEGEDCIRIRDPQNLTIRESSPILFQILDGNSIPYSARSREEAERIVEIVQHYNARFTCYVERPDPGMVYLRR